MSDEEFTLPTMFGLTQKRGEEIANIIESVPFPYKATTADIIIELCNEVEKSNLSQLELKFCYILIGIYIGSNKW